MHFTNIDDSIFVNITHGSTKIVVCVAYVPPKATCYTHSDLIHSRDDVLIGREDHRVIVVGDFNLPNTIWGNKPLSHNHIESRRPLGLVPPYCAKVSTTRTSNKCTTSIRPRARLDLLFASPNLVRNSETDKELLPLDDHHKAGRFIVSSRPAPGQRPRTVVRRDFLERDYTSIIRALEDFDWGRSFSKEDLNEVATDLPEAL